MPTGSQEQPDAFTEALMQVVRAKMGMLQLSIADVSRTSGIPRATLSRIVNSKREADLKQMRRISLAIEIPMAQLFTAADNIMNGKDPF